MNEVENTYRALTEKPELVTGRWCWAGWHRWTKWTDANKNSKENWFKQHRHCADCNRAQLRLVKEDLD
jgi:hypothetical protein